MSIYKSYGIYGIRNKTNGFVYIGKTEKNFGNRRDSHFACLRNQYHSNKQLQADWNEYGEECFIFEILHECCDGSEDLNKLECDYIEKYRTAGICYNILDGGTATPFFGKRMPEDVKAKIGAKNRVNMTGKKLSEETKKKMSESQKSRYSQWTDDDRKKHCEIAAKTACGYKWSDESRKSFSEKQSQKPNGAKYSADTVREIRHLYEAEGRSNSDISKILNIPQGTVSQITSYRRWKNLK